MNTNIFVPTKINVGFQERKDTYTGKLAYVIDGTVDNTREELFKVVNMLFTTNPTLYTGGQVND